MMDDAGVDAAVIHPPSGDPGSQEMGRKAVKDYPDRCAIMGTMPLDTPEQSAARIDRRRWVRNVGLQPRLEACVLAQVQQGIHYNGD